jgi:hypothetical protein
LPGGVGGSWSRSSVSHSSKRHQLLQQQQCSKFHNHYALEHFQSSGGIVQSCCLESGPPHVNWNWVMNGWMNDSLTEWMNEWLTDWMDEWMKVSLCNISLGVGRGWEWGWVGFTSDLLL